jgi:hypothetical protein
VTLQTGELGPLSSGWPKAHPSASPRADSHGERITISAEAADLSRDLEPAVGGQVFWYRPAYARGASFEGLSTSAAAAPRRGVHLAIDAYVRGMELAAAA